MLMVLCSAYFHPTFVYIACCACKIFVLDTLATDYQYTFDLSKKSDAYLTQINFVNIPEAVSTRAVSSGLTDYKHGNSLLCNSVF